MLPSSLTMANDVQSFYRRKPHAIWSAVNVAMQCLFEPAIQPNICCMNKIYLHTHEAQRVANNSNCYQFGEEKKWSRYSIHNAVQSKHGVLALFPYSPYTDTVVCISNTQHYDKVYETSTNKTNDKTEIDMKITCT